MKLSRESLLLYAVTDSGILGARPFLECVEDSLRGGVTFLQLREKTLGKDEFLQRALSLRKLSDRYGVPFVVNDDIGIALGSGADGVHIGQTDGSVSEARRMLGEGKILGVSASTAKEAIEAERCGADYLGVGAVFPTSSKDDALAVPIERLGEIARAVSIPVVAIGGISYLNAMLLGGSGISGIAVISAIYGKDDIEEAARKMAACARKAVNGCGDSQS